MSPSAPPDRTPVSKRLSAKARCAATARMLVHLRCSFEEARLGTDTSSGQQPHKANCFWRPPAANIQCQDNKSGPAIARTQVWVGGLLAPPCCSQHNAISI